MYWKKLSWVITSEKKLTELILLYYIYHYILQYKNKKIILTQDICKSWAIRKSVFCNNLVIWTIKIVVTLFLFDYCIFLSGYWFLLHINGNKPW